jgi:hypothetical protein
MLDELRLLLRTCIPTSSRGEYRAAIIEHNCVGKRTAVTRRLTDQRLGELYALDPTVLIFRSMRQLWQVEERGQPLLALLLAMARDPLLRITAPPIIRLHPGEELGRQQIMDALARSTGNRFNEATLDKILRNAAASWTQSGHLRGRGRKTRLAIRPTPATTAFALLLGYILGGRGPALFETLWARILDASVDELIFQAMDAKRLGLLDIKQSGGVVEVSMARMLTDEERRLVHGTD